MKKCCTRRVIIFHDDKLHPAAKTEAKRNHHSKACCDGLRVVEIRGFEPLAFALRTRRSTN